MEATHTTAFFAVQAAITCKTQVQSLDQTSEISQLLRLSSDFNRDAVSIGTQIIREQFMPPGMRLVPPVNAGGVAGGTTISVPF